MLMRCVSSIRREFITRRGNNRTRHCERSEAIQSDAIKTSWIASSLPLLAMTPLQFAVAPEALTTSAHFARSAAMNAVNWSGVIGEGTAPISVSLVTVSGIS